MNSNTPNAPAKLASPEDVELCRAVADHLLAEAQYDMAAQFYSAGTSEALLEKRIEETQGKAFEKREHLAGLIRTRREKASGRDVRVPPSYPGPLGLYSLIRLINGELKIKPDLPSHLADKLADESFPGWRQKERSRE